MPSSPPRLATARKRRRTPYKQFELSLGLLVYQHMPWPYDDVERSSQEAIDAAEAIAKSEGPKLWKQMRTA